MSTPGKTNNPNGRPKGKPNKATRTAREAIAAFVEGNTERLERLLDRIEEENAKAAFDCIMAVIEYHIPKLARTELTGKDGKDLNINWPLPKTELDKHVPAPESVPALPPKE